MDKPKPFLKIKILGCAGSYPTKDRNVSAIYGQTNHQTFLLDAGENVQKSILENKLDLMIDFVVITHTHIDHFFGILPLIQTMDLHERKKILSVYVPDKKYFLSLFTFLKKEIPIFLNVIEINPLLTYKEKDLNLNFFKRNHGSKILLAYGVHIFSEKSEKFDCEKLKVLNEFEKNNLFKNSFIVKNDKKYLVEDFIEKINKYCNLVYTGDGTWDPSILNLFNYNDCKGGLLITECTHYYPEDKLKAKLKKHTHYSNIKQSLTQFKNIDYTILTHLGQRISPDLIKRISEKDSLIEKNVFFAYDNMEIEHNNLERYNQIVS